MKQTPFQQDVLKLAKAMEQGMRKTKPTRGAYMNKRTLANGDDSKVIEACALGAAYVNGFSAEKMYNQGAWDVAYTFHNRWPALKDTGIYGRVISLNDVEGWTRRRIINWLRRVAKLPAPPVAGWHSIR